MNCRVSLLEQFVHDFDISHYKSGYSAEASRRLSADEMVANAKHLATTFQSLYKLRIEDVHSSGDAFDTIVIDEPRTLLPSLVCSVTNKGFHLQENHRVLKYLLASAKNVVLLDADLEADKMVRDWVSDFCPGAKVTVQRYHGASVNRTIRHVTVEKFRAEVKEAMESKTVINIPCRTKASAMYWKDQCDRYKKTLKPDDKWDYRVYCDGYGDVRDWAEISSRTKACT